MIRIITGLVLVLTGIGQLVAAASDTILNNGQLRFGNGSEASVNTLGNLMQPFYWNGSWYKLTYSNYALNQAFGVGGDGTNRWNTNGDITVDPTMNGPVFEAGGITYTSGNVGYGTLVVSGSYTIGATSLDVEQRYELPDGERFIKAATTITNNSGGAVSNLRYWVGTRDDYIGNDDTPIKERGSIDTGSFVRSGASSDPSPALLVSSGSEGVLFFSPQDTASAIIDLGFGAFNDVVFEDPDTSPVYQEGDDCYGLFVRLPDLANGDSASFSWYYAAGATAELDAVIAAVADDASAVSELTATTGTLTATSSVTGTGYWLVVPDGSAVPTEAEIVAGVDYGAVTVTAAGSGAITADTETDYSLTGLSPVTDYTVFFVGFDGDATYSDISSADFTTEQATPTITTAPSAANITYGQTLSNATLSGGASEWNSAGVVGTFAFSSPGTTPAAGTANQEVTFTPTDTATYTTATVQVSVTVNSKVLSVSGLSGDNKVYDGSTDASASGTASLSGVVSGDSVSLGGTPSYTFVSAGVGVGIGIITSGFSIGGADAGNYSLSQPGFSANIGAKDLTITGLTAIDKTYDTATSATVSGVPILNGVVAGDGVTLGGTPSFSFVSASVATGITVTGSGFTLGGADAGNYSLSQPSLSANISAKQLTISGLSGNDKTYDASTDATASGSTVLNGVLGGDSVSLAGTPVYTFAQADIGTSIGISTSGYSLSGADAGNYSVSQPGLSGDISAKALTVSGLSGDNKIYDGSTDASASGTASLQGVIAGDSVSLAGTPVYTFAQADIGTSIGISTSGFSISGDGADNYSLSQPSLSADISGKQLSISGLSAVDKVYDGSTTATANGNASLQGVAAGDSVSLDGSPAWRFASADVGTGIGIDTLGYRLGGADAGNYSLVLPSLSADITSKQLTIVGLVGNDKAYDGETSASASGTAALTGLISGDSVSLTGTASYTFTSTAIGSDISITVSGFSLSGTDASNYQLQQPTLQADITAFAVSITGLSAVDKVYDGSTDASVSGNAQLDGVRDGDVVTLTGTPGFTFAQARVGTGISITTTGYGLSGADAGNYSLVSPQLQAAISTKQLTISGLSGADKRYDGTVLASANGNASLDEVVAGDEVSLAGELVCRFAGADVGSDLSISCSGYQLSGADATNYRLTHPSLRAAITARSLVISAEPVTKAFGSSLQASDEYTAFTGTGLVTDEQVASVSVSYGAGAEAQARPGVYPDSVSIAAATGDAFDPDNYQISYQPADLTVSSLSLLVTLDPNGGDALEPDALQVVLGNRYGTLPTPIRSGYTFAGWQTASGDLVSSSTEVTISSDHTLTATWRYQARLTLRGYLLQGDQTIQGDSQQATLIEQATAADGSPQFRYSVADGPDEVLIRFRIGPTPAGDG